MSLSRFELLTSRLSGEHSNHWVIGPYKLSENEELLRKKKKLTNNKLIRKEMII